MRSEKTRRTMSNDGKGHVYAPVGLAEVAQILGEPLTDTGTVCCSEKINPYSLIRPLYANLPGRDPAYFADASANTVAVCVPSASRAEMNASFDMSAQSATVYPCVNEYAFPANAHVRYAPKAWGFYVPYVTRATDIFALKDVSWRRFYPADAPTESHSPLAMFDGYLNDAVPAPLMSEVKLEYGEPAAYTPVVAKGAFTKAKILGPNPTGHPGGVVNVPAVLGSNTNLKYGVTLYVRKRSTDKFTYVSSGISTKYVGQTAGDGSEVKGDEILAAVTSNKPIVNSHEAMLIPWVAEGNVTVDSAGLLTVGSGARIYSLRYDRTFQAHAIADVKNKLLSVMSANGATAVTVTHMTDATWRVGFVIINPYPNYPLTASSFSIDVGHTASSTHLKFNFTSGGEPGASGTVSGPVMTIGGQKVNSATIEGGAGAFGLADRQKQVYLYFNLSNATDSVTSYEIKYQCGDPNHTKLATTPITINSRTSLNSGGDTSAGDVTLK